MSTLESTLMKISAKAWTNAAAAIAFVPDVKVAQGIFDEFRTIQRLADDALVELRGQS